MNLSLLFFAIPIQFSANWMLNWILVFDCWLQIQRYNSCQLLTTQIMWYLPRCTTTARVSNLYCCRIASLDTNSQHDLIINFIYVIRNNGFSQWPIVFFVYSIRSIFHSLRHSLNQKYCSRFFSPFQFFRLRNAILFGQFFFSVFVSGTLNVSVDACNWVEKRIQFNLTRKSRVWHRNN